MKKVLFFSAMTCLLVGTVCPPLFALRDGNEEGESARRNLYEYDLYDRNRDRTHGRGIYRNLDRAYPEDQYYPKPYDEHNKIVR